MAKDPTGLLVFIVASRILIGIVLGTGVDTGDFKMPSCTDITDILTGCGDIWGITSVFVLGTIPGIHWAFNFLLAFTTNVMLVWSLLTLLRGN